MKCKKELIAHLNDDFYAELREKIEEFAYEEATEDGYYAFNHCFEEYFNGFDINLGIKFNVYYYPLVSGTYNNPPEGGEIERLKLYCGNITVIGESLEFMTDFSVEKFNNV